MDQELIILKKKEIITGIIYHVSMILLMFLCALLMLSSELVLSVIAIVIGVVSIYGLIKTVLMYYFFQKEIYLNK